MKAIESPVRAAVAAGSFYFSDATTLRENVQRLLATPETTPAPTVAAIAPHAGLAFSGECAAEVFARIHIPRTVVLLGPNHYDLASQPAGASLWRSGAFATPLGQVQVDEEFASDLLDACSLVAHDPVAHGRDHALEVELPFLIERAAPRRPAIVPILLRWDDWQRCRQLAEALAGLMLQRRPYEVLLLASSDMTHFEPAAAALRRDQAALDAIVQLDGEKLLGVCREQRITMCGRAPAAVVIEAARRLGAHCASVVAHTHSGVASGDDSNVVSYAGVVVA